MSKRICGECTQYSCGMCANFDSPVSFRDEVCEDFCPCEEWEPMFEVKEVENDFDSYEEAIAATVAKLEEVAEDEN